MYSPSHVIIQRTRLPIRWSFKSSFANYHYYVGVASASLSDLKASGSVGRGFRFFSILQAREWVYSSEVVQARPSSCKFGVQLWFWQHQQLRLSFNSPILCVHSTGNLCSVAGDSELREDLASIQSTADSNRCRLGRGIVVAFRICRYR